MQYAASRIALTIFVSILFWLGGFIPVDERIKELPEGIAT